VDPTTDDSVESVLEDNIHLVSGTFVIRTVLVVNVPWMNIEGLDMDLTFDGEVEGVIVNMIEVG
jgi:hypothetical protein